MRMLFAVLIAASLSGAALAREQGLAKPNLILHEKVAGMPVATQQDVRVMTAVFKPGDRTVTHTHRFPVTVYVLEGSFTLELAGRDPIVVKAGESLVEPANVKMTGYNRSATEPLRVVIFYVSDVDTPFLDLSN